MLYYVLFRICGYRTTLKNPSLYIYCPDFLSHKTILYLVLGISNYGDAWARHSLITQILRSPNPYLYSLGQAHDSQLSTDFQFFKLWFIAGRQNVLFFNISLIPKLLQLVLASRYKDDSIGNKLLVFVLKRMPSGDQCFFVDEESSSGGDRLFSIFYADQQTDVVVLVIEISIVIDVDR